MNAQTKQEEVKINFPPEDSMLSDMARQSFTNLEKSGKLQEMMDAVVTKSLKDVMESVISNYSAPFKKEMEEYFKATLKFNPDTMEIGEYQEFLRQTVTAKIKELHGNLSEGLIDKALMSVIGITDIKDEYTLEELIAITICKGEFISSEDTDWDGETRDLEITLHLEIGSTLTRIYFDKDIKTSRYDHLSGKAKEGIEKYACKYSIVLYGDGMGDKAGTVHSVKANIGEKESGINFLLNAKFRGTVITDCDELEPNSRNICKINVTDHFEE